MESSNQRLVQAWLDLQCTMIQGAVRGAVMVGYGAGSAEPVAVWPAQTRLTVPMLTAANTALAEQRQVVEAMALAAGSDIAHGSDVIALPLVAEGNSIGAVVIEMTARMKARQDAAMQVLAWGNSWLETVIEHLNAGPNLRLNIVVETIAEAVKHDSFGAAAAAVANAIGRLLDCSRVSVGFVDGRGVEVAAMSNTARFEQRTNLVRSVAASMTEAIDQDRMLSLPGGDEAALALTRAHQHHQGEFGSREIHTLPFADAGKVVGAVVIERNEDRALQREDLALADTVVSIVGPILYAKRNAELPVMKRTAKALRGELRRFVEPGHLSFKVGITALATLLLLAFVIRVDYEVHADATLLGEVQRAVVAPFDGYIAEAPLRAGDMVALDGVLGRMDSRDLALERNKWTGERAQIVKERQEALAKRDRAKLSILNAELQQAEASLALAQEKVRRAELRAPIDGIIVSGDLSQSLGAPVKRGDVLFEVAPLNRYRIVLEVDERDIAEVHEGQQGRMALASLPHLSHPFTVERIVPTSTAADGQNVFTVEARLDKPDYNLRPGMAGVGKVEVGRRPLIWTWTHRLSDKLRLMFWRWWG
ncbi:MAG: efflux RND transporter periplasmic adaptor subunit [Gammaproteobacteria bacterium]